MDTSRHGAGLLIGGLCEMSDSVVYSSSSLFRYDRVFRCIPGDVPQPGLNFGDLQLVQNLCCLLRVYRRLLTGSKRVSRRVMN
jgi:hypothetical protein